MNLTVKCDICGQQLAAAQAYVADFQEKDDYCFSDENDYCSECHRQAKLAYLKNQLRYAEDKYTKHQAWLEEVHLKKQRNAAADLERRRQEIASLEAMKP